VPHSQRNQVCQADCPLRLEYFLHSSWCLELTQEGGKAKGGWGGGRAMTHTGWGWGREKALTCQASESLVFNHLKERGRKS